MFKIDTRIKQEALNFAVLMNCLKVTEPKFDPLFESFLSETKATGAIIENLELYSRYFKVDEVLLTREYKLSVCKI